MTRLHDLTSVREAREDLSSAIRLIYIVFVDELLAIPKALIEAIIVSAARVKFDTTFRVAVAEETLKERMVATREKVDSGLPFQTMCFVRRSVCEEPLV
jgi:hypothetical protein